jgi:serine/threonine protein phosphatase PrpC
MQFETAHLNAGRSGDGDDRCAVRAYADRLVVVVADGAGGSPRGARAAEIVVKLVCERSEVALFDPVDVLRECDEMLARDGRGGETTAVFAMVDASGIKGASVGDSGAWLVDTKTHVDLTCDQIRKPLVGSGEALPVSFRAGPLTSTLLIATDGLLKYASAARIRELASAANIESIPEHPIASVRLRSGCLQDDTTVVVCRRRH